MIIILLIDWGNGRDFQIIRVASLASTSFLVGLAQQYPFKESSLESERVENLQSMKTCQALPELGDQGQSQEWSASLIASLVLKDLSVYSYLCTPVRVYAHSMHADAHGGQRRGSDSSELELQVVVTCLMWVLRIEPHVLFRISKCSWALSYLSSPLTCTLDIVCKG